MSENSVINWPMENEGVSMLYSAMFEYIQEVESDRITCSRHSDTTAIHAKGQNLQIYRLFDRDSETAACLRKSSEMLPGWEESIYWSTDSSRLEKMHRDIVSRMERHKKQQPVVTRGISWNDRPILIHAYKFEPDTIMKIELVMPTPSSNIIESPYRVLVDSLECHEFLVPNSIAQPLPPYEKHETEFLTLQEYLDNICSGSHRINATQEETV